MDRRIEELKRKVLKYMTNMLMLLRIKNVQQ